MQNFIDTSIKSGTNAQENISESKVISPKCLRAIKILEDYLSSLKLLKISPEKGPQWSIKFWNNFKVSIKFLKPNGNLKSFMLINHKKSNSHLNNRLLLSLRLNLNLNKLLSNQKL